MTSNESSNELPRWEFSAGNRRSERAPCPSSQLFTSMNVHVIPSARWGYNPRAVYRWIFFGVGATHSKASSGLPLPPPPPPASSPWCFTTKMMMESHSFGDALNFYGWVIFPGEETESSGEACLVKAAQFALRFLARCSNRMSVIYNLSRVILTL